MNTKLCHCCHKIARRCLLLMFKGCREGISDEVYLDVKILVEETNFSLKMDTWDLCT